MDKGEGKKKDTCTCMGKVSSSLRKKQHNKTGIVWGFVWTSENWFQHRGVCACLVHRLCLPTCSIFVSVDKGIFNYCNYHLKIGFLPQTIEIRFCYFLSLLMSFNLRFHFLSAIKYGYARIHVLGLSTREKTSALIKYVWVYYIC